MATNIKTMYTSNQITCFPLNDLQRFKREDVRKEEILTQV